MKRTIFAVGLFCAAAAGSATAHEGAMGVVRERMVAMSDMSESVKAIQRALETGGDSAVVVQNAERIRSHAGASMIELFSPETDRTKSRAKQELWERMDEFKELANRLEASAATLAAEPTSDNMRGMLRNCGSCHQRFREKR